MSINDGTVPLGGSAVPSRHSTPSTQPPKVGVKRNAIDSILPAAKMPKLTAASSQISAVSSQTLRDTKFGDKLKKRSGLKCELTGLTKDLGLVDEGAQIFGLATSATEPADKFWKLLYMFWDSELVDEVRAACRRHKNDMSNGIVMDIRPHRLWEKLYFYLEFVDGSYEKNGNQAEYTVTIRFPRSTVAVSNFWASQEDRTDGAIYTRQFRDGDKITFKTEDQTNCPLPDPILLQLRALITKCAFLRGGGEREERYLSDEDRQEQIYAALRATLIDYGDDTYSDEYESNESVLSDGYDHADLYEDDTEPDNTDKKRRVESWIETIDVNGAQSDIEKQDGEQMDDGHAGGHHGTGDE
jgi:hypothetical protein